jgi:hypothetical protein
MAYQVEQHQIKRGHQWWDYCAEVCFASKNLFNTAQYTNRQSFIYGCGVLTQAELDKMFNSDIHYKQIPAKVSQLVLKQISDSWQSYFKASSAWKLDSSKFTGKPKMPGYLDRGGRNLIKFNTQAIGAKAFKSGVIVPSKSPIELPVKPGLKFESMVEVRIVPKTGCYVIEVVYDDGSKLAHINDTGLAAAIDVGIDNLATIVFSDPKIQPIAINGKPLKSENQWMNKEVEISQLKGKRNIAIVMNASTFSQATDIDYFITNASTSIVTPEWIVNTYSQRNWVEVFYREAKGWLGLKEYQVRDKRSLLRHFTLVFCAYTFILWHQMTGGLRRRWASKPLNTFTEALEAFRTAMSYRFFDWLTHNRDVFAAYKASLGYIWA